MATLTKRIPAVGLALLAGLTSCKSSKDTQSKRSARASVQALNCAELQPTGVAPGQVAPGISLQDGSGKEVKLHSFCDKTVLLIASSMF